MLHEVDILKNESLLKPKNAEMRHEVAKLVEILQRARKHEAAEGTFCKLLLHDVESEIECREREEAEHEVLSEEDEVRSHTA